MNTIPLIASCTESVFVADGGHAQRRALPVEEIKSSPAYRANVRP